MAPKFALRHYKALAEAIQAAKLYASGDPDLLDGIQHTTEHLSVMLRRDNPGFKEERFLEACKPADFSAPQNPG